MRNAKTAAFIRQASPWQRSYYPLDSTSTRLESQYRPWSAHAGPHSVHQAGAAPRLDVARDPRTVGIPRSAGPRTDPSYGTELCQFDEEGLILTLR